MRVPQSLRDIVDGSESLVYVEDLSNKRASDAKHQPAYQPHSSCLHDSDFPLHFFASLLTSNLHNTDRSCRCITCSI